MRSDEVASAASKLRVSVDTLNEIAPAASGELAPYFRNMISGLKRNWKPSTTAPEAEQREADALLTIQPSGEVLEIHLEGVTHNQVLNRSSWDALGKMTLAPLPNAMNNAPLRIRVHFIVD